MVYFVITSHSVPRHRTKINYNGKLIWNVIITTQMEEKDKKLHDAEINELKRINV